MDTVRSETLALLPHEAGLGIVEATAVVCGRAVVVIVKGSDGMMATGSHFTWPEHAFDAARSIEEARGKAWHRLMKVRVWRAKCAVREARKPAPAEAAE